MGNIMNISCCGRVWEIMLSDMNRTTPPYILVIGYKSVIYYKINPMTKSSGITSCIYV